MDLLRLLDTERFLLFTAILTRVSGLIMLAPVYGTKAVPVTVRALLAFAVALLVMPVQWNTPFSHPGTMLHYLATLAGELLVGASLGMGIIILLSGIQMAGELMSRLGGLNMADVFDPTFDANVPLFSRLLFFVSTAVFVAMDGHRAALAGLLDTFQTMPPGSLVSSLLDSTRGGLLDSLTETFEILVTESFRLGIRASVPVVAAVLLGTLVLGLIGRTLPQLNVLMLGVGLNSLLTFAVFALSLGVIAVTFQEQIGPTLQTLLGVFHVTSGATVQ